MGTFLNSGIEKIGTFLNFVREKKLKRTIDTSFKKNIMNLYG